MPSIFSLFRANRDGLLGAPALAGESGRVLLKRPRIAGLQTDHTQTSSVNPHYGGKHGRALQQLPDLPMRRACARRMAVERDQGNWWYLPLSSHS